MSESDELAWPQELQEEADKLKITFNELQELLKDRVRLDWLAGADNEIGNVQLPRDIVERNLTSLRAAIDEAMKL